MIDSSLEDISKELTNWSGENKIFNSILVISALTADVFLCDTPSAGIISYSPTSRETKK